ncbi:MAG: hypothetical protein ACX93O_15590 [Flagellimonas sp.]
MIFKRLSIIISISVLLGCNNLKKKEKAKEIDIIESKDDLCLSKNEKEKMLETILRSPDFQLFLHPEVEGRLPIRLQKNEFVTENLKLKSNGLRVVFEDSLDLPYGNVHRLRIVDKDCKNQKFEYSIFYPIEGAIITGTAIKSDTIWLITNTNWGIKD